MDFPFNPFPEFAHGCGLCLFIFKNRRRAPVMGEAFLQSAALVVGLQPCDFKRVDEG
jgi:hypothetical protein